MDAKTRIERALDTALVGAAGEGCPPRLAAALRHAVFPTGALIRPRLCLAVAWACGEDNPVIAESVGASIELLHCASLVHDDLPCFDDAQTRRGRPSVHSAFGEPLAVLAGDALIVLAFETLASVQCPHPRLATLMRIVAASVGAPRGIVAGQAWESEPKIDLAQYHREKTGSLFAAATMAGAAAAGADPKPWRQLGEKLGEAYQVADDLRDAAGDDEELGKPVARDAALGRPSAALAFGIADAMQRLEALVSGAIAAIPACRGAAELEAIILAERKRLVPKRLARQAA